MKIVKSKEALLKYFKEIGATQDSYDHRWTHDSWGEVSFNTDMFNYCAKVPTDWAWLKEWLEEVEAVPYEYKTKCITPCPHEIKSTINNDTALVFSYTCDRCKYRAGVDEENKIVYCRYKEEKKEMTNEEKALERIKKAEEELALARKELELSKKPKTYPCEFPIDNEGDILFNDNKQCLYIDNSLYRVHAQAYGREDYKDDFVFIEVSKEELEVGDTFYRSDYKDLFEDSGFLGKWLGNDSYAYASGKSISYNSNTWEHYYKLVRKDSL